MKVSLETSVTTLVITISHTWDWDTDINQIKQRVYFKEVTKILSSAFMLSLEQVSTTVSIFQTDKTAARQCRQPGC